MPLSFEYRSSFHTIKEKCLMGQLCPCSQDTTLLFSAAEINVSSINELNLVMSSAYIIAKCFVYLRILFQKIQMLLLFTMKHWLTEKLQCFLLGLNPWPWDIIKNITALFTSSNAQFQNQFYRSKSKIVLNKYQS